MKIAISAVCGASMAAAVFSSIVNFDAVRPDVVKAGFEIACEIVFSGSLISLAVLWR